MNYQTVSEIYEANDNVRERLKSTLGRLTDEQASARPDGEKWSISEIAEHVSMVGGGALRICGMLLKKAEEAGRPPAEGAALDLKALAEKTADIDGAKLEAPEIVRPSGGKTIAESLAALDAVGDGFRGLMPLFDKFDTRSPTFPHPYFGDMSAVEWLVLYGAHEERHLRQIEKILAKLS